MGLHLGILASDAKWTDLFEALDRLTGAFQPEVPISEPGPFRLAPGLEPMLIAGQGPGFAMAIDTSLVLSSAPDLIAALAAETNSTVIGCGAEETSGTYYVIVSRRGEMTRHFFHCVEDLTEPFSRGESLLTESSEPLDSAEGLFAALDTFGFTYASWVELRPLECFRWTGARPPPRGPHEQEVEDHRQRHRIGSRRGWLDRLFSRKV